MVLSRIHKTSFSFIWLPIPVHKRGVVGNLLNCVPLFSSMTGRKNKRIQRRCHETAAKAPTVPLSVQLYDQQPTVKLVLIFLNTFDLESCLLCYTIFFSLISTHDTGAQSILAEMYVCGKRISFRTKCIHAQKCIYTLLKSKKEPVTVQMKTQTATQGQFLWLLFFVKNLKVLNLSPTSCRM